MDTCCLSLRRKTTLFSFLHAWYKEMTLQRYINYCFRGDFYLLRFRLKMIQICEEILIFFLYQKNIAPI